VYILTSTACTAGSIQANTSYSPVSGHGTQTVTGASCTTAWTSGSATSVIQGAARVQIVVYSAFNSVTGSPVYNLDAVIEQLQ
jgi:predicted DNA-binding helix-hairpin-helix protein